MNPNAIGNTNIMFGKSTISSDFKNNGSPAANGLNSCFGTNGFLSMTGGNQVKQNSIFK